MKINFSMQGNGACPFCKSFDDCKIVNHMKEELENVVLPKFDDRMEIVIYSCPEFEENWEN